jgi:hypothetical protein
MAQTYRAVAPVAGSVWPTVADHLGHALEEERGNRPAIEMIDPRNSAHRASEAKEKGKAPDELRMVAYYPFPQLDPGVAVEGGDLLVDADQQFRRFPAHPEQPE